MAAAFQDIQKNPANVSKYENNPKVKKVMEKLAAKIGSKWAAPTSGIYWLTNNETECADWQS